MQCLIEWKTKTNIKFNQTLVVNWIDPNNNSRMVIADDGGAQVSNDGGENWTTYHNQPTAQF